MLVGGAVRQTLRAIVGCELLGIWKTRRRYRELVRAHGEQSWFALGRLREIEPTNVVSYVTGCDTLNVQASLIYFHCTYGRAVEEESEYAVDCAGGSRAQREQEHVLRGDTRARGTGAHCPNRAACTAASQLSRRASRSHARGRAYSLRSKPGQFI